MDPSVPEQVRCVRTRVGLWPRLGYTFIRFEGDDVATWLQTQTTNDVLALKSGEGHANARLDRKGHLQAHFTLHRWEDDFWLLTERQQSNLLLEQLNSHLFLEDVRIADASDEVELVAVQGPRALTLLASCVESDEDSIAELLPASPFGCHPIELFGFQVIALRISIAGEDGYILVTQSGDARPLLNALLERGRGFGTLLVGEEAQDVLRIEAGIPRFGLDMDTSNRLPETTLERDHVSYEKGCYLGQEVVAKLRTYGSVRRALMGLIFESPDVHVPFNSAIVLDGKETGVVKSVCFSPTLGRRIALAYLDREHRTPGRTIEFRTDSPSDITRATVKVLPFHTAPGREERAGALYNEAIELFQADTHDQDDSAIHLLKEAVLLDPRFEDAYEALGVILHRHHRVDEAIRYMQVLERLNPDSVMAHTNLSVFYVAKGLIEEAEQEKAKAAVLQLRNARESRRADELAAAERERIRTEALERIRMFEEVLTIDPDDSLATYGMGMAYVQLNEHEKAIPFLERAAAVQKDYSAAFLNLGKCHEVLGNSDAAERAYMQGIEAANRKGDLMPLREMERRLKALAAAT